MTDGFDLHGNRHRLKQLRDDGDAALFGNPEEMGCPACGRPFDRLLATRRTAVSLPPADGRRLCLVRGVDGDRVHLFRHRDG